MPGSFPGTPTSSSGGSSPPRAAGRPAPAPSACCGSRAATGTGPFAADEEAAVAPVTRSVCTWIAALVRDQRVVDPESLEHGEHGLRRRAAVDADRDERTRRRTVEDELHAGQSGEAVEDLGQRRGGGLEVHLRAGHLHAHLAAVAVVAHAKSSAPRPSAPGARGEAARGSDSRGTTTSLGAVYAPERRRGKRRLVVVGGHPPPPMRHDASGSAAAWTRPCPPSRRPRVLPSERPCARCSTASRGATTCSTICSPRAWTCAGAGGRSTRSSCDRPRASWTCAPARPTS